MARRVLAPAGWTETAGGVLAPPDIARQLAPRSTRAARRSRVTAGGGASAPRGAIEFEAAEDAKLYRDWYAPQTSAVELIGRWQQKIVGRARELSRNAPWFVGLKRVWVDNTIGAGTGWGCQFKTYDDELGEQLAVDRNKRLELWWRKWARGVDASRRMSLEMFLRLAEEEYAEVGEYFILMRTPPDPRPVPLSLELFPTERLDPTYERQAGRDPITGGRRNRISNGIEFDEFGARVAYHFDRLDGRGESASHLPKVIIPAARICHRYLQLRAGQERGIPPEFAAMLLLRDVDDAVEFELEAWQAQSRLVGAIHHANAGLIPTGQETDEVDQRPVHRIDGATFLDLSVNEKLTLPPATRPNKDIDPFVTFAARTFGKTVGFSYEATTGDYSKVNFSSGRLGELSDRRTIRRNQSEMHHISLRPVVHEFVFRLAAAGRVEIDLVEFLDDPERFTEHRFIYPGREHHDPGKEVTAAALRILAGLSTLEEECAALGRDWEANLEQIAREVDRMAELGIPRVTIGGASYATGRGNEPLQETESSGGGPAQTEEETDEDEETDEETDDEQDGGDRARRTQRGARVRSGAGMNGRRGRRPLQTVALDMGLVRELLLAPSDSAEGRR